MPLYEYRCPRCDAVIAKLFGVRDAPRHVPCPSCRIDAGRIVSKPSVHLSAGAKVARLDPKYDKMVERAMRNTASADPDRLINRRGDIAKGRDDP